MSLGLCRCDLRDAGSAGLGGVAFCVTPRVRPGLRFVASIPNHGSRQTDTESTLEQVAGILTGNEFVFDTSTDGQVLPSAVRDLSCLRGHAPVRQRRRPGRRPRADPDRDRHGWLRRRAACGAVRWSRQSGSWGLRSSSARSSSRSSAVSSIRASPLTLQSMSWPPMSEE